MSVNIKCGVHTLITGKTDSGKSALAKKLVSKMRGKYKKVLVLDLKRDPNFFADFATDEPAHFLAVAESESDCLLVLDESGETVGQFAGAVRRVATVHRDLGHSAIFISQRGAMLDKTIREQCSNLFAFRQGVEDAAILARSFPALRAMVEQVERLEQGQFIFVPSFGPAVKGRAF